MTNADRKSGIALPFAGLRVVQHGSGIEVAMCAKVLGDAGADVVVVEPAAGHHLRHRLPGHATGDTAPIFSFLFSGMHSALDQTDNLFALLEVTDVIVTDALPSPWTEIHQRLPHVSAVLISPFGSTGPWAGRTATDLTLQAMGGGMAPRGEPASAPLMVGGEPTAWFAGALAAVSLLGVLPRVRRTGNGEFIDVSMLEACHVQHGMHPITYASIAGRAFQTARGVPVPGIEPTANGYVGFFVITGQQWLDFTSLIGRPDWGDDPDLFVATRRRECADELLPTIRAWTMERTTEEIVEVASLLRIPVAPIGSGDTLPQIDQFVSEEWFVDHPDGFVQPRRPYRFEDDAVVAPSGAPALGSFDISAWRPRKVERAGQHSETTDALPLAGIRVADFTGFWAGPMASGILAGLGAEVVHIEGPRRPDGIRMNSVRAMTEPEWWEWSPLFAGTNTNKRDLAVDLTSPAGREVALRLLATCDVMIENFSPRVVDQLGLGPDTVRAANPNLVLVRMPAFGLEGPWRDRVGFAQTIEQAVGLAFLTGYEGGVPVIPNGMCDPLAGVFGAIAALAGLAERQRTGNGQFIESPMVGAGLLVAAEQVVDYSASGFLHRSLGNRSLRIEQDVYPCIGDDDWVAISMVDETMRQAVRDVIGPGEFEATLRTWCATRQVDEVVDTLWPLGVAVGRVRWAHELLDNEQLISRKFFERVDHPLTGAHPVVSWPARFGTGTATWNRTPAPTLGQDNDTLLAELGYTTDEIRTMYDDEVVARAVLTSHRRW